MEESKMHDTFLLNRISETVKELCYADKIIRITKLKIITKYNSHIQRDNLYEHLLRNHSGVVGEWTELIIVRQDIEDLTAVIELLEGDTLE
jgi:hypothetical protein